MDHLRGLTDSDNSETDKNPSKNQTSKGQTTNKSSVKPSEAQLSQVKESYQTEPIQSSTNVQPAGMVNSAGNNDYRAQSEEDGDGYTENYTEHEASQSPAKSNQVKESGKSSS